MHPTHHLSIHLSIHLFIHSIPSYLSISHTETTSMIRPDTPQMRGSPSSLWPPSLRSSDPLQATMVIKLVKLRMESVTSIKRSNNPSINQPTHTCYYCYYYYCDHYIIPTSVATVLNDEEVVIQYFSCDNNC